VRQLVTSAETSLCSKVETRKNAVFLVYILKSDDSWQAFWPDCHALRFAFCVFTRFQTHLSRGRPSFMEDEAVKVVGQIGQGQFGLRTSQSDCADEKAKAPLLMPKHMLYPSSHR